MVRLARLLSDLLVHLQSKTRALLRLCRNHCRFVERYVSALSETLWSVSLRETHHHSQQPTISVFTRKDNQTAWLDHLSTVRTDLRLSVERALATVRALL